MPSKSLTGLFLLSVALAFGQAGAQAGKDEIVARYSLLGGVAATGCLGFGLAASLAGERSPGLFCAMGVLSGAATPFLGDLDTSRDLASIYIAPNLIIAGGALYGLLRYGPQEKEARARILSASLTSAWLGTAAWMIAGSALGDEVQSVQQFSPLALGVGVGGAALGAALGYLAADTAGRRSLLNTAHAVGLAATFTVGLIYLIARWGTGGIRPLDRIVVASLPVAISVAGLVGTGLLRGDPEKLSLSLGGSPRGPSMIQLSGAF